MDNKKDELLIIVPGIKTLNAYPTTIQNFVKKYIFLYDLFKPFSYSWLPKFKNYFKKKYKKVIVLHWSRELFLKDRNLAEKKFIRLVKKYQKKYSLKVIAVSLSAEFVLRALKEEKNLSIEKIVLVAGINRKVKTNYNIVNFYSPDDDIQKIGETFLVPLDKSIKLIGNNVKNISIKGLKHEAFLYNSRINFGKYKGKKTFELINEFLN